MRSLVGKPMAVIDPSALHRKIVEVCLRREHILCLEFPDGTTALRALEGDVQRTPELIFVEIDLPDIDGLQVVRLLRSSARYDRTAIVLFTSHDSLLSRLRARLAGADAYLTKPFHRATFLALVARYRTRDQSPGVPDARATETGDCHDEYSDPFRPPADAAGNQQHMLHPANYSDRRR